MFNMKEVDVPKGVWLSTIMMSAPLFSFTFYLTCMSLLVQNPAMVDPAQFAFVARTCLRLLSLNISFFGGIHYGFGAASYDTARSDEEKQAISYQIMYSFVPATIAFISSNIILFQSPLTVATVTYGFTALMVTQFITLRFDQSCVQKELAPIWFKKYRQNCFAAYLAATSLIFWIYYSNLDKLQQRNDPNRIENIKNVL